MANEKINRNDPCPCGSGKKYKQCCQQSESTNNIAAQNRLLESIPALFKQALKHQKTHDLSKAESLYRQVLEINPKHIDTLHNLGVLLRKKGDLEQAHTLLNRLVKLEPTAAHYCSLADVFSTQKKHEEAIASYEMAISLNPGDYIAYNNLGTLFASLSRFNEAVLCYQKTISLNAKDSTALDNLGMNLISLGKYKEAAYYLKKAILAQPHVSEFHSRLLFSLCFDAEAFPKQYLDAAQYLNSILKQQYPEPYKHQTFSTNKQNLRVGFVSRDLHNHPVGYFLEGIIKFINQTSIELFAYQTIDFTDDLTMRIKPFFSQWHQITALTDIEAAQQINNDKIDILIDLAGHTGGNRLPIFFLQPAPIQVCWLGYWASTGLKGLDYFLTDSISTPPNLKSQFTEKLWYMPDTRLCFTPPLDNIIPEVSKPFAVSTQSIRFGCFQSLSKINDDVLRLWVSILNNMPESQLIIKNKQLEDANTKQNLIQRLCHLNAPMDSIILLNSSPRAEYLSSYNTVDIMLDTFPYPGGTTTCEALWMGVPTLTLTGNTLLARQGVSILSCVGLNDWIAQNENDYVQKAVNFANNKPLLRKLKQNLRATMKTSPLVDAECFAKNLEKALFAMWNDKMR